MHSSVTKYLCILANIDINTSIKDNKVPIKQFTQNDVEIITINTKYQGFFKIEEYQLRHRLFNGGYSKTLSREIFERGDAVVLMPYDVANDAVVFVTQFRSGALKPALKPTIENQSVNNCSTKNTQSPWLIEFVAGMFNENENPVEVAIREAKEEANLDINEKDIEPIMQYLSSPGGTTENIHLYIGYVNSIDEQGKNIAGVYGLDEEGEDILVSVVPRVEAMQLLAEGKINNAATVIGLQWLQLNYQRIQIQQLNAQR